MNPRSNGHIIFKKLIAAAAAVAFVSMDVGYAAPGAPFLSQAVDSKPPAISRPNSLEEIIQDPSRLQIPFEHVTLKEVHQGTNGKLIIHIQDAHANLSGQKNLAHLLESLLQRYEIPLIFVEGASKEVTLDALKQLPEDWPRAARRFLQDGLISGEEYLNLSSDLKMNLVGIEDADLYDQNLEAYAALKDRRAQALVYLRQARISIERLKARLYPQEILDLERASVGPEEDLLRRMDRLTELSGFDDLTHIGAWVGLRTDEARIDFERAHREQTELLLLNGARGAADEIDELPHASKEPDRFLELKKYRTYLSDFTKLNMDELWNELEILEKRVYEQRLPDDDAKTLHAVDRFIQLLQSAYEIRMNSSDSARLNALAPAFRTESWQSFLNGKLDALNLHADLIGYQPVLDDSRALIKRFYSSVAKRDDAFVSNARRIMQERDASCAFLIAGGYHTENLTKLLRAEGTSYIVLAPLVTEETDPAKYEKLLLASLPQTNKDASKYHVDALRWKALAENGGGNVRFAQLYPSGDAPLIDHDAEFVSALNRLAVQGARYSTKSFPVRFPELYDLIFAYKSSKPGQTLSVALLGAGVDMRGGSASPQTVEVLAALSDREGTVTVVDIDDAALSAAQSGAYQWYMHVDGDWLIRREFVQSQSYEPMRRALAGILQDASPEDFDAMHTDSEARLFQIDRSKMARLHIQSIKGSFDQIENYGQEEHNLIISTIAMAYAVAELDMDAREDLLARLARALKPSGKIILHKDDFAFFHPDLQQVRLPKDYHITAAFADAGEAITRRTGKSYTFALYKNLIEITRLPEDPRPPTVGVFKRWAAKVRGVFSMGARLPMPDSAAVVFGGAAVEEFFDRGYWIDIEPLSKDVIIPNAHGWTPLARVHMRHARGEEMFRENMQEGAFVIFGSENNARRIEHLHPSLPATGEGLGSAAIELGLALFEEGRAENFRIFDLKREAYERLAQLRGFGFSERKSGSQESDSSVVPFVNVSTPDIPVDAMKWLHARNNANRSHRSGARIATDSPKVRFFKRFGGMRVYNFARLVVGEELADRVLGEIIADTPIVNGRWEILNWKGIWRERWEELADAESDVLLKSRMFFAALSYEVPQRVKRAEGRKGRAVYRETADKERLNSKFSAIYIEARRADYAGSEDPPTIQRLTIPFLRYEGIPAVLIKPQRGLSPGRKPPVVTFYHGLSSRKEHPYLDRLEKLLVGAGIAVLRVDLPRHGDYKDGIYGPGLVNQYSLAIKRFTDHHPELDGKRAGIFGFSFGGNVAIRTMMREELSSYRAIAALNPPISHTLKRRSDAFRFRAYLRYIFQVESVWRLAKKISSFALEFREDMDLSRLMVITGNQDDVIDHRDNRATLELVTRLGGRYLSYEQKHYFDEEALAIANDQFSSFFKEKLAISEPVPAAVSEKIKNTATKISMPQTKPNPSDRPSTLIAPPDGVGDVSGARAVFLRRVAMAGYQGQVKRTAERLALAGRRGGSFAVSYSAGEYVRFDLGGDASGGVAVSDTLGSRNSFVLTKGMLVEARARLALERTAGERDGVENPSSTRWGVGPRRALATLREAVRILTSTRAQSVAPKPAEVSVSLGLITGAPDQLEDHLLLLQETQALLERGEDRLGEVTTSFRGSATDQEVLKNQMEEWRTDTVRALDAKDEVEGARLSRLVSFVADMMARTTWVATPVEVAHPDAKERTLGFIADAAGISFSVDAEMTRQIADGSASITPAQRATQGELVPLPALVIGNVLLQRAKEKDATGRYRIKTGALNKSGILMRYLRSIYGAELSRGDAESMVLPNTDPRTLSRWKLFQVRSLRVAERVGEWIQNAVTILQSA